jgi:hypothetical protein
MQYFRISGVITSINVAYIINKTKVIVKDTDLKNYEIGKNLIGL